MENRRRQRKIAGRTAKLRDGRPRATATAYSRPKKESLTGSSRAPAPPGGILSEIGEPDIATYDSEATELEESDGDNEWRFEDSQSSASPSGSSDWPSTSESMISDRSVAWCDGSCFRAPSVDTTKVSATGSQTHEQATQREGMSYRPVKPWQFRILELTPDQPNTVVRGRLFHAALALQAGRYCAVSTSNGEAKVIQYRALSYTWGRSLANHFVELDGQTLAVTSNLHAALVHLRSEHSVIHLWVDAICIDQKSLVERGQQVSNMLQIFQAADGVDVWLGEKTEDSDIAMAYISRNTLDEDELQYGDLDHTSTCIRHAEDLWLPLFHLYARPWLRRTWIRQEIFAAKTLLVHCGSKTVPWQSFVNGFEVTLYLAHDLDIDRHDVELEGTYDTACELAKELSESTARRSSSTKPARNFLNVLASAHNYGVADERDAVYAVLGMCDVNINAQQQPMLPLEHDHSITVDYTKSISEVWTDVAVYTFTDPELRVSDEGDLPLDIANIFNLADLPPQRQKQLASRSASDTSPGLPAWVFDWHSSVKLMEKNEIRECLPASSPKTLGHYFTPRFYRALGAKYPDPYAHPPPKIIDRSALKVNGYIIGVVKELTNRTCDLIDFFDRMHDSHKVRKNASLDNLPTKRIRQDRDTRRLARIALKGRPKPKEDRPQDRSCLALVPIAARPGDLIIVIACNVLPLVITPRTKGVPQLDGLNIYSKMFLKRPAVYEDAKIGPLRSDWIFLGTVLGNVRLAEQVTDRPRDFVLH